MMRSALSLSIIALLVFTGCASTTKTSDGEAKKVQRERDYEYVEAGVGSRIPRRVRKGESADANSGSSPVGTLGGEQARGYIGNAGSATSSNNN